MKTVSGWWWDWMWTPSLYWPFWHRLPTSILPPPCPPHCLVTVIDTAFIYVCLIVPREYSPHVLFARFWFNVGKYFLRAFFLFGVVLGFSEKFLSLFSHFFPLLLTLVRLSVHNFPHSSRGLSLNPSDSPTLPSSIPLSHFPTTSLPPPLSLSLHLSLSITHFCPLLLSFLNATIFFYVLSIFSYIFYSSFAKSSIFFSVLSILVTKKTPVIVLYLPLDSPPLFFTCKIYTSLD